MVFVATVATFLVWFRRCRRNAEVLTPGTHRYAPGVRGRGLVRQRLVGGLVVGPVTAVLAVLMVRRLTGRQVAALRGAPAGVPVGRAAGVRRGQVPQGLAGSTA
ncbi:uncharacterized protein DUF4328 [Streptomyces sp. TLI_171]|nr:uncharacterized protein DUF4328 [Streptomyces sp. TLI_171]